MKSNVAAPEDFISIVWNARGTVKSSLEEYFVNSISSDYPKHHSNKIRYAQRENPQSDISLDL